MKEKNQTDEKILELVGHFTSKISICLKEFNKYLWWSFLISTIVSIPILVIVL